MKPNAEDIRITQVRFWDKVRFESDPSSKFHGCMFWTGALDPWGFGKFKLPAFLGGHTEYAHKVSFFLHHGRMPTKGMKVLQTCHNRRCVNPQHIFELDLVPPKLEAEKKAAPPKAKPVEVKPAPKPKARREAKPMKLSTQNTRYKSRKLSRRDVQVIKYCLKKHYRYGINTWLANIFDVNQSTISMIKAGKIWSDDRE